MWYKLPRERCVWGKLMTKIELPDGVPFDNEGKTSMSDRAHDVPDMATPQFKQPTFRQDSTNNQAPQKRASQNPALQSQTSQRDFSTLVEDDEHPSGRDLHDRRSGGFHNQLMIIAAIAALLVLLGAVFISMNKGGLPLCSSQPSWNQFNCRAG